YAREQSVEHAIDLCMAYAPHGFVYTDYDRMLVEAEADFIYIANANHVHYEFASKALHAGHHVIVEKPIAVNRAQTEMLFDAALIQGKFCLPAFSLLYMPLFRQLVEVLPQIGTVRMVHCNFAQYSSRYDRYLQGDVTPVFDPEMAGGCLADLNIYNLCFCIALFGPPFALYHHCNRGYNGVDTSGALVLRYRDSVATLTASKDSDGLNYAVIQGEQGWIEVKGTVSILQQFTIHRRGCDPVTYTAPEGKHRLSYEFEEFLALLEDEDNCHIRTYFLARVAQEIAATLERKIEN
ncbi:MAG: Gfo/Idh/MocA family oxidoreductase, partial [Bacteroidaceae bacterium]|nr:Gfo/Idh/MocA family oxidoreductase [Bacteroidaceae bacterium]